MGRICFFESGYSLGRCLLRLATAGAATGEGNTNWGIIGSLVASLVLLLIQFPEHTPGLWAYGLKLVLAVWTGSFVLIVLGLDAGRRSPRPWRRALIICGALSMGFNALGGLAFLWEATTSAGGV